MKADAQTNELRTLIASRLVEARKRTGYTQAHVTSVVGMRRSTLADIERGMRRVLADELVRFADCYKVDILWLLGRDATATSDDDTVKPLGFHLDPRTRMVELDSDTVAVYIGCIVCPEQLRIVGKFRPAPRDIHPNGIAFFLEEATCWSCGVTFLIEWFEGDSSPSVFRREEIHDDTQRMMYDLVLTEGKHEHSDAGATL